MRGSKENPFHLAKLVNICAAEQNISLIQYITITNLQLLTKKNLRGHYYKTDDTVVHDKGEVYILTRKTLLSGFRSVCGKSWPIDYQFEKIVQKQYFRPNIKQYATNETYRDYSKGGAYHDETLYLKDGIYYADFEYGNSFDPLA